MNFFYIIYDQDIKTSSENIAYLAIIQRWTLLLRMKTKVQRYNATNSKILRFDEEVCIKFLWEDIIFTKVYIIDDESSKNE